MGLLDTDGQTSDGHNQSDIVAVDKQRETSVVKDVAVARQISILIPIYCCIIFAGQVSETLKSMMDGALGKHDDREIRSLASVCSLPLLS